MAEIRYEAVAAGKGAELGTNGITEAVIVPNSEFQVFELTDTTFARPLTMKTENGLERQTIPSSSIGILPAVTVNSPNFEHMFVSGDFRWWRTSFDGARKLVEEARTAAQEALAAVPARVVDEVKIVVATGALKGETGPAGVPTPSQVAEAVRAIGGPTNLALDTDGIPYISAGDSQAVVLFDADGAPYYV